MPFIKTKWCNLETTQFGAKLVRPLINSHCCWEPIRLQGSAVISNRCYESWYPNTRLFELAHKLLKLTFVNLLNIQLSNNEVMLELGTFETSNISRAFDVTWARIREEGSKYKIIMGRGLSKIRNLWNNIKSNILSVHPL